MRLIAALLLLTLMRSDAAAQTANPPTAPPPASDVDAQAGADPNLPLSVRRIREALGRAPEPGLLPTMVEDQPTFRIEIRERRTLEELVGPLELKAGPRPWGGFDLYEQQRILHPYTSNPLAQPWSAFDQKQLLIVGVTSVLNSLVYTLVKKGLTKAHRKLQERAARINVARDIEAYCATLQNGGAGIVICDRATAPLR